MGGLLQSGALPSSLIGFKLIIALSLVLITNLVSHPVEIWLSAASAALVGACLGKGKFFRRIWLPCLVFGVLVPLPSLFLSGPTGFLRLSGRTCASLMWVLGLLGNIPPASLPGPRLLRAAMGMLSIMARRARAYLMGCEARGATGAKAMAGRVAVLLFETEKMEARARRAAKARGEVRAEGEVARARGPVYALRGVEFGWDEKTLFSGLNLEINPGITVIRGDNGSGKTSLLLLLAGLEFPRKGEILFFGTELSPKMAESRGFRRSVGVLFQDPYANFLEPSVLEDVSLGPRLLRLPDPEGRVRRALAAVGAEGLAHRSPFSLSLGEAKRVALAGILAVEPSVWLLDEPFEGMDARGREMLAELIERLVSQGKCVVITEPTRAKIELPPGKVVEL